MVCAAGLAAVWGILFFRTAEIWTRVDGSVNAGPGLTGRLYQGPGKDLFVGIYDSRTGENVALPYTISPTTSLNVLLNSPWYAGISFAVLRGTGSRSIPVGPPGTNGKAKDIFTWDPHLRRTKLGWQFTDVKGQSIEVKLGR